MSDTISSKQRSQPIFVVGVPRSGTTLLAAMLAAHSRLGCGPETNFFALLGRADRRALFSRATWPQRALEWLSSPLLEGESLLRRFELERSQLEWRLKSGRRTPEGLLTALMEAHLAAVGKARWIEKSPVHALHLETLRRWFPAAPVVRIVRDPRDVALSVAGVPWGPGDYPGGLLYWRRFDERSARFFATDRCVLSVRYEDLLQAPDAVLADLCHGIGEIFERDMLTPGSSARSLMRPHETWKGRVEGALDPGRAGRWRSVLGEDDVRLAHQLVGDRLAAHGYDAGAATPSGSFVCVRPRNERLAALPLLLDGLRAAGSRIWPREPGETPTCGIYVGDPDENDWLGYGRVQRLRATFSTVMELLRLRVSRRAIHWVGRRARRGSGVCAKVLGVTLRALATSRELPLCQDGKEK